MRYLATLTLAVVATAPAAARDMDRMATAVFAAAAEGNVALLQGYLDSGYDVNYQRKGDTALSMAVVFKRPAAVRLLLERGANPAMLTYEEFVVGQETPRPLIDYARKSSSSEIVALLQARLNDGRAVAPEPAIAPAAVLVPAKRPVPTVSTGRASTRWAAPGSFAPGQTVLISTSGGLNWRSGKVLEIGGGDDERQYLVVDGNNQTHWLDWTRVTATTRQTYWTHYLVGDWKLHTGMSSVVRTNGRDLYRVIEGGMKLPPLRINADGSYVWTPLSGKPIRSRWTARPDEPGMILKAGEKGLDWTLYNSTSKSSIDASGADEIRLTTLSAMGSIGSRIGK